MMGLSFAAIVFYSVLSLLGSPPPGTTTLIVLSFLIIVLNSLGIEILGEYLGRTYGEIKQRPLYVVQKLVNLKSPAAQEGEVELQFAPLNDKQDRQNNS
jgi:dolichol-phosphate mannosyltransferase